MSESSKVASVRVTIDVDGDLSHPRDRVLVLESAVRAICDRSSTDRADAVMLLLVAAVHLSAEHSGRPTQQMLEALATALGAATVAADDFFGLKQGRLQ